MRLKRLIRRINFKYDSSAVEVAHHSMVNAVGGNEATSEGSGDHGGGDVLSVKVQAADLRLAITGHLPSRDVVARSVWLLDEMPARMSVHPDR